MTQRQNFDVMPGMDWTVLLSSPLGIMLILMLECQNFDVSVKKIRRHPSLCETPNVPRSSTL